VRQDCAQRLEELTHAIPTLVLEAKDAAGNDLGSVRVTMDGKAFADRLDGNAVSVDPGEHQFTFQADGYESLDKTVVVRIAEKDRVVRVVLNRAGAGAASASASGPPARRAAVSATATASASPPPSTETPSRGMPGTAWVSFGVGAAGLVVGAIFTGLWASAKSSGDAACGTPGTCTTSTANHWESMQRNDSIGLGVGFGVAAVGIGLGLAFALAHHGGEAPPATARVGVDPNGGSLRIEF
jgi:hypothetical protein